MDNLTPRQQFILSELLNKKYFNIDVLHKQLGISTRTILREISYINDNLKKQSISIFNDDNMNLCISGRKDNIQKIKESLNSVPLQWLFNKEQRQIAIVCELLISKESLKISYFSYKYNVVKGSISLDLDSIEKSMIMKNLCLIRKRSSGIKIEGSEWDKRNALVELFFNFKSFEYLLSFLYDEKIDETVKTFFQAVFDLDSIELVKCTLKQFDLKNLKLNDIKYFTLFILILLSIKKTKDNDNICLPEKIKLKMRSSKVYRELKPLSEVLVENNIRLPEDEITYWCLYLNDYKYCINNNAIESDINFEDIAREIVMDVSKRICIDITEDKELFKDLSQHMKRTFHILNIGLNVLNPMTDEIKRHYPQLFKILMKQCRLIFSRYNLRISADEVGYIIMHIGVAIKRKQLISQKFKILIVCLAGISSAKILKSEINSLFPDVGDIYTSALHDIDIKTVSNKYDLILSTVPISLNNSDEINNIIEVSPFMSKNDINKVRNFIFKITSIKQKKQDKIDIVDNNNITSGEYELANTVLKNFHLKRAKVQSFEELIKFIVKDISESNIVKNRDVVKDLILKREQKGNVVVPNSGTALLHTRSDEMAIPFVGVYRIDKFFSMSSRGFSTEGVNTFLVLLARNNEYNYILQFLGKISAALIEKENFVKILKFGEINDIRNCLIDVVNEDE